LDRRAKSHFDIAFGVLQIFIKLKGDAAVGKRRLGAFDMRAEHRNLNQRADEKYGQTACDAAPGVDGDVVDILLHLVLLSGWLKCWKVAALRSAHCCFSRPLRRIRSSCPMWS